MVIRALEMIEAIDASCGDNFTLSERFYTAHIERGAVLEQRQQPDEVIAAYQQALTYLLDGEEAIEALSRLGFYTPTALIECDVATINLALAALPDYVPVATDFIQIEDGQLMLSGQSYTIYGVNYYPRDYPYQRFLTEMEVAWVDTELSLAAAAAHVARGDDHLGVVPVQQEVGDRLGWM